MHGHQTLPQLRTHQWDVPFEVPMSICPLCLALSFYLYGYGRRFFMQESPTQMLIFWIDTFGIRCHKINSVEFNISGETLVRPYGD